MTTMKTAAGSLTWRNQMDAEKLMAGACGAHGHDVYKALCDMRTTIEISGIRDPVEIYCEHRLDGFAYPMLDPNAVRLAGDGDDDHHMELVKLQALVKGLEAAGVPVRFTIPDSGHCCAVCRGVPVSDLVRFVLSRPLEDTMARFGRGRTIALDRDTEARR